MANTYTVVWGDTLSGIALKHGTTVAKLVKLNGIKDPDYIVVGQVLKLTDDGTTATTKTSTLRATIKVFGLQSNTDRTLYTTWAWNRGNTDHYEVKWYYATSDGTWFVGKSTQVKDNQSLYTAPANAYKVKFKVKPISKKRKVNNKETSYWTAGWSTEREYNFKNDPPLTPPVPVVAINGFKLTATLDQLDVNGTSIQFQIVKDDKTTFKTGTAAIVNSHASYLCTITAGSKYKVRARSCRGNLYSSWSQYSANKNTVPDTPSDIKTCKATSKTSVYLEWDKVKNAKTYDIEFATKKRYFDSSSETETITGIPSTRYEKTGLESGQEYFFRVRSVNDEGTSAWSKTIVSVIIGKAPSAPTTWSSTTTAITGDSVKLYWVHNSEDGSSQTYAELALNVDGVSTTYSIQNTNTGDNIDKTSSYTISTKSYTEGTKIRWKVRTAGITGVYGGWSVERTIDVYAPPTLELSVTNTKGNVIDVLESFPMYVKGITGPNTQTPIGYHLTIVSNQSYETVDTIGNFKMVSEGEEVYSNNFDTNEQLVVELSASNLDLENNMSYTVKCTSAMNSGLTADAESEFTVAWEDEGYETNAEISIDPDTLVAYVRPYCLDARGEEIYDVLLSVYRREYDGKFIPIETNIEAATASFVTDPHPSLDYARYRIVATYKPTGAVAYYDIPGYPVQEKAVVIQWDDEWSNFDTDNEDEMEKPAWSGSMLKLPYNIDVSDKRDADVSLIEYIGRSHPVSYYGTQVGETQIWNTEIDKTDAETLYALRRLSVWMGDVYVREPSGSGYWANINVSFSQKHCELTIPVTISVTRVEGGM